MRVSLPEPAKKGLVSVEQAVNERRSLRDYDDRHVDLADISQLLWAAQGITGEGGLRAAPSAGAIYPMTLFVFKADGVFKYDPMTHSLEQVMKGDSRRDLSRAALGQETAAHAPLVIVAAANMERMYKRYMERAYRYCDLEAGHIAQNVALQAHTLKLATVPICAFDDDAIIRLLDLKSEWRVCYILPVGHLPD